VIKPPKLYPGIARSFTFGFLRRGARGKSVKRDKLRLVARFAAEAEPPLLVNDGPGRFSEARGEVFRESREYKVIRGAAGYIRSACVRAETEQADQAVDFVRYLVRGIQDGSCIRVAPVRSCLVGGLSAVLIAHLFNIPRNFRFYGQFAHTGVHGRVKRVYGKLKNSGQIRRRVV
jgi:hypothetical protein